MNKYAQGQREMVKGQILLRTTEARKLWRDMTARVLKGHGT